MSVSGLKAVKRWGGWSSDGGRVVGELQKRGAKSTGWEKVDGGLGGLLKGVG